VPTAIIEPLVAIAAPTNEIPSPQRANAMSAKRRAAAHGNTQMRSKTSQKASTRDALTMTEAAMAVLKNASDSMLSTAKEMRMSAIKLLKPSY